VQDNERSYESHHEDRGAERSQPLTLGARLVLAQAISAAIPAHWSESVSVTTTAAALAWRANVIGKTSPFWLEFQSNEP
jgi:hypothetical protein